MIQDFRRLAEMGKPVHKNQKIYYGTIDPSYTAGQPKVIVDGSDTPSDSGFLRLASYTPTANDRVMIVNDVIIGKIV